MEEVVGDRVLLGEAPLWDFPDGTLYRREYAAYVVSEALGWRLVPPTLLRAEGLEAEAFAAEDEDAWCILPLPLPEVK